MSFRCENQKYPPRCHDDDDGFNRCLISASSLELAALQPPWLFLTMELSSDAMQVLFALVVVVVVLAVVVIVVVVVSKKTPKEPEIS